MCYFFSILISLTFLFNHALTVHKLVQGEINFIFFYFSNTGHEVLIPEEVVVRQPSRVSNSPDDIYNPYSLNLQRCETEDSISLFA